MPSQQCSCSYSAQTATNRPPVGPRHRPRHCSDRPSAALALALSPLALRRYLRTACQELSSLPTPPKEESPGDPPKQPRYYFSILFYYLDRFNHSHGPAFLLFVPPLLRNPQKYPFARCCRREIPASSPPLMPIRAITALFASFFLISPSLPCLPIPFSLRFPLSSFLFLLYLRAPPPPTSFILPTAPNSPSRLSSFLLSLLSLAPSPRSDAPPVGLHCQQTSVLLLGVYRSRSRSRNHAIFSSSPDFLASWELLQESAPLRRPHTAPRSPSGQNQPECTGYRKPALPPEELPTLGSRLCRGSAGLLSRCTCGASRLSSHLTRLLSRILLYLRSCWSFSSLRSRSTVTCRPIHSLGALDLL